MDKKDVTVVICCAGMGTRLGIGTTKALVRIGGKPLIIHQLEMLNEYKDVRIVVGYQAEQVIDVVREYRNDILFVFNNDYRTTGPGISLAKALVGANKYILSMDGDVLVQKSELTSAIETKEEFVGGTVVCSDETIYVTVREGRVLAYTQSPTCFEECGIVKIQTSKLLRYIDRDRIVDMVEPWLPLPFVELNAREIDTPDDYERMTLWYKELKE